MAYIRAAALFTAILIAACAPTEDLTIEPQPIGQFRLGHNIAIAEATRRGDFADGLTATTIEATLQNAIAERLRRYDGDGLYHLGLVIRDISLAEPGLPGIYAARPRMIVDVTVFDNDTGETLNPSPIRITAGDTPTDLLPILGTGPVRDPEDQLTTLSADAAAKVEAVLRANPGWFEARPGQVRVPFDLTVPPPPLDRIETSTAPLPDA